MVYNPYNEDSIEDVLTPNLSCLHPVLPHSHYEGVSEPEGSKCGDSNCFKCHKGSGISREARQYYKQLLERLPGHALCHLMGRLYKAKSKFLEKIRFYREDAYVLGSARDIFYVPWDKYPCRGRGEIYVILDQQISNSQELSVYNTKGIFSTGPLYYKEGPWWDYIKSTLNPLLTREVEAAEAEQQAEILAEKSAKDKFEADRVSAWANRHRDNQ